MPEFDAFKSVLLYSAGILILPILSFFLSKLFVFDGEYGSCFEIFNPIVVKSREKKCRSIKKLAFILWHYFYFHFRKLFGVKASSKISRHVTYFKLIFFSTFSASQAANHSTWFHNRKFISLSGIYSSNFVTSNVCSAVVAILVLHISLGFYIYKAYVGSDKTTKKD